MALSFLRSFVLAFLFVCGSGLADTQNSKVNAAVNESSTLKISARSLPVLSTRSGKTQSRTPERLRHKSRTVESAPQSLSAEQYRGLTGQSRPASASNPQIKAGDQPSIDYLVLSPRNPWSTLGWLDFREVVHVNPDHEFASFFTVSDSEPSSVRAFLKVQKGKRYLIDFSINAGTNSKFMMSTAGDSHEISVNKGKQHLLMYLDAAKTETAEVILSTRQAVYAFYTLEATRID